MDKRCELFVAELQPASSPAAASAHSNATIIRVVPTLREDDAVARDVRDALRELREAAQTCRIQLEAVALAERRVASTALFLEAGRVQVRDVLESEGDLLAAQNALTAARITYRRARWALARDTGTLDVDDEIMWK